MQTKAVLAFVQVFMVAVLVFATTSSVHAAGVIQDFQTNDPGIEVGHLVTLSTNGVFALQRADRSVVRPVTGIVVAVSKNGADHTASVSLTGPALARFTEENGAINVGDRVALSSTPGLVTRASSIQGSIGFVIDNTQSATTSGMVMLVMDIPKESLSIPSSSQETVASAEAPKPEYLADAGSVTSIEKTDRSFQETLFTFLDKLAQINAAIFRWFDNFF